MLLYDLLRSIPARLDLAGVPNLEITGVREDSRQVRPGDLFVARPGTKTDGSQFLEDARRAGAVAAIVTQRASSSSLPQVVVRNIAAAASALAMALRGRPDKQVKVVGITGTNGKTTTAYLVRHLLNKTGSKCGVVGTVEIDDGSGST